MTNGEWDLRDFRKWQRKHPNFMTPDILKLKKVSDKHLVELSKGRGIDGENIYGVSVLERTKEGGFVGGFDKLSKMFYSEGKAIRHMDKLSKQRIGRRKLKV